MESIPPNTLPGTLPSSNIKTINSQEVLSEETTPGTKSSLPTSLPEELSSSAGTERLPTRPPVKSQIDSTVEEHQYGSQTVKEKSLTNSQEYQIQPPQQSSGPVVVTEFKPESGTNVELKGGNLLHPQSQICFTVASPGSQSSVGFKVQELPVHTIQSTHRTLSGVAESVGSRQDSKSQIQITQTDTSETKPKTVTEISHDAVETWNTNSLESVETFICTERHPRSVETLPFSKAGQSAPGRETSVSFCGTLEEAHVDRDTRDEHADTTTSLSSSGFSMLPEFSSSKESSSNPPAGSSLPDTSLVVSLQAGTSHTSDQVPSTETSLFAEILRSSEAQEIVVVRDGGDWSNMHLNQNYLLQREDGSVCQAAIVNQLSAGEPKLYEEGVQARVELHSQPVEVYEFCSLVEEVAEETICVGGSSQIPHSPGYEVNLFNALLENADEDLEPSIHTVAEADTIIISQEAMASPNDDVHNVAVQNPRVTTVGQHLVLNSNQTVEVAHMSEVCLVQVAAVTADSFTVEETDVTTQTGIHCSQTSSADLGLTQVSNSAAFQRVSTQQEAVLSPAVAGGDTEMSSAVSVHVSSAASLTPGFTFVSAIKPEFCVSSQEGNRVSLSLTETKPEAFCTTYSSTVINPKLLLFKPGETPLLKHPPSLQAKVSKQPSVDGKLAGAHSSLSGTASKECLPQPVLAAESPFASAALGSHKDQTQCSVHKTSTATTPVKVQQTALVIPTASTSKSEALTFTQTSTKEADPSPPNVATFPGVPQPITPQTFVMLSAAEERDETDTASINPNDSNSYPDYAEDESEDMDQYQDEQASDIHEVELGHVSSPEEDSDDEPDPDRSEMTTPSSSHKHGESRTDTQAVFLKVRQWIADRVTVNSSPSSPSTSTSFLGPSSTPDWKTPQREKTSPLRGPHGKFVSPSSVGYSSSSSPPDQTTPQRSRGDRHTDMAELAKHEADIENRTQSLKKEGFWSMKRLSRLPEPQRTKVHWDYLCEEMQWLSADFAQERRWKRGVARKVVRMVMRHHEELRQKEEKAKRDEHAKIRRVAASIAKEVRAFWSNVEKVVQFKQQSRLEEKRKKALDLQLDFIVGQTEKYSDLLSKSLARPADADVLLQKSLPPPVDEDDRDFEPPCEEDDDEETIEVEEQQEGNDAESHQREIELLKEESMLPLDQLLSTLKLPPSQESGSEEECSNESSLSAEEDEDGEFTANEEDAEDEEDTIAAQEKVEGNVNHAEELNDLAKEGDMSLEELLEKYKGAYASDFEAPSASASKASSDSEVSGDEEVENEEDESDVESNTSSSDSPGDSADDDTEKDEEEDEECGDEGMELLLKEGDQSPPSSSSRPKKEISHIAATAESLQPKGYTLATTKVKIPIPFLLHGTLREYQHIGLDWLVTMYEKKLNGILADEMGLGKTIQTIALLAHLACEKGNWGPHLIIVPTSVMLNWEMELKRWCPGFKILTYFGSQKERKLKRQGWTKPNAFHVCITSYKLVLQDHQAFRRKSWRYLILDEAQNIKNFKSQRWQSLLNFNSHRRLLLTGTPLQNSLMELWSLMHFLMPHVFQSHREFKEWFSNPLTGMIEGSQEYNEGLVKRLHKVLRPFLLRRIKADVEKQMPKKYEHVVRCRLSKRQRFLYDDFMAQASTRETLASGHFMSVINILMQLRKVCNHPNLFDPRPIQSPFITQPIVFHTASLVQKALEVSPLKRCDLSAFDLVGLERHVTRYQAEVFLPRHKVSRQLIQDITESPEPPPRPKPVRMKVNRMFQPPPKGDNRPVLLMNKPTCSVPPAAQTTKPPPVPEATPAPASAPVVQQAGLRPPIHPSPQTAVRSSAPRPILTVRPPTAPCAAGIPAHSSPTPGNIMPQRVLLSPDMQARLPSGEVVSIAQLASLAGRPVSSSQGSKPVTFQLQGNKLTLSGAQIHQVPAAGPRPVQGNVMHLVSSGMQHHLISQPAQLTVQTTTSTHAANTPAASPTANKLTHNASPQVPSSMVSSPGVVKIVVRQASGKEGGPVPSLAVAPSPRLAPQAPTSSLHHHSNTPPVRNTAPLQIAPRTPGPGSGPATAHYTIAPLRHPSSNPNQLQPLRPVLKVVQPPPSSTEQPAPALVATLPCVAKPSAAPQDNSSSNQPPATTKSKPSGSAKTDPPRRRAPRPPLRSPFHVSWLADEIKRQRDSRLDFVFRVNERRCGAMPVYGHEVLDFLTFLPGPHPSPAVLDAKGEWSRSGHSSCLYAQQQDKQDYWFQSPALREAIHSPGKRVELLSDVIDRFVFAIPPVEAPVISMHCCHPPPSLSHKQAVFSSTLSALVAPLTRSLHRIHCNMRTQFPDLRLIQYDCGKLQTLHTLLRKLKSGGHRVLIFTQMTRMLDVLEQFLNYHGHIYLRLDGSTRVEQRQALMERFNADRRIFCFILSTRSGGVGVNLTGADTVVFYDSDWNPTMDAQAQDRCHRIGQTRDVHIYRLISERTVEENILKKANQKRMLGDMAIEGGNFTTAFFKEQTIRELFDVNDGEKREVAVELSVPQAEEEEGVNKQSTTILEQALCRAEDEEDIVAASQAKAEQVAELAEFNENIPLDDGGEQEEVEELSKAEQEIAALVEQLTPIERYAMNFLEASLEDVCKEELKQAEEQVEAARKGLDQAKEEGLMLHPSSDEDDEDFLSTQASSEPSLAPARRGRKPKDRTLTSTRTSGRLRGASPEPEPQTPREVPERLRSGLRGRPPAKDSTPLKASTLTKLQDSKSFKALSPTRDQQTAKTRTQPSRSHPSPVPSPTTSSPTAGKQQCAGETDSKAVREEKERRISESSLDSSFGAEHLTKDDDGPMSPPSTSSRSPRKRQTADGEVLRGLVDDSPSAKVLRKLPGRLVTVVEEKEPRRRRRRGSEAGGSSEEVMAEEHSTGFTDELSKDNTSQSPDEKPKPTADRSPQDHDSGQSLAVHPQPVRGYPPYSPPHLSPDMPVLRNLPVRRRLETESRMAAQLGEQQHLQGRGRGASQTKKTDTESSINCLLTPLKRKRGRPPKTPTALPEPETRVAPSPSSPSEDGNPPLSPKRKRGRPRKDTTATSDVVCEVQNSNEPKPETRLPPETTAAAVLNTDTVSKSTRANEAPTEASNSAQPSAANTVETSMLDSPLIQAPAEPTEPLPASAATSASVQCHLPSSLVSPPEAESHTSLPSVSARLTLVTSTAGVSTAALEPSSFSVPIDTESTEPDSGKSSADDATSKASPPPAAAVQTLHPSFEPSITESVTTTDELHKAATATPQDLLQDSAAPTERTGTLTPHGSEEVAETTLEVLPCASQTAQASQSNCTTQVETEQTTLSNPTTSDQNIATVTPSAEDETTSEKTEVTAVLIQSVSTPPTETGVEAQVMPEPERSTEPFATSQAATPAEANPSPETYDATPAMVNTSAETSSPPTVVVSTTTTCSTPATVATETVEIPASILPSIESPSEITSMSSPEKTLTPMEAAQISTFPSFCSTQTTAIISPVEDQSTSIDASKETPTETPLQTDATADASEKSAKVKETKGDSDREIRADAIEDEAESNNEENVCKSLPKRRKVETSSEPRKEKGGEPKTAPGKEAGQEDPEDQKLPKQKRSISRESSQESVRSSSPSSGSSSSTLTRHAHHKKTYENRHPAKRRRVETSEGGMEDREEDETKEEADTAPFCRRCSRSSSSSSSSSDSDSSESRKRLTRSAKRRQQDQEKEVGNKNRKGVKVTHSSERSASNNATTSTGGESGSDTSSVRMTRKSAGSQPAQDSKAQTNSAPLLPPEPEVLGKRCSALNAAAKLLAMKGRVDTPGHTTRKDSGAKAASSSDKNQKPKSILASPQSNSVNPNGNKNKSGKPPTPDQTSRPVSRSTRQCPGQLVPPLEVEYKRPKPEEKESKKLSRGKEGEGHSACSSMSSDGEGDCGRRSSRSRSSSNSSQRTRSISSQNTEHRGSRATSSGSERDRDRSPDRAKGGSNRKERQKDRKDNRRSLKTSQEVTSSSGTEGMPDRVLRSVAALAAVQARSPAASTRSSNQQRNKT
ncbi:helicase SRCAP isoform X3 [Girardinichthys multiradiatus]|uniref:helicase SRCAP isoform X3 n=1 Tax=Girardinichthys multiradiatus TaxID=208333 RepID=UPI001FAE2E73|nr:helicase SRCAP isoform X3 [Girardinichthys multiradiatus]